MVREAIGPVAAFVPWNFPAGGPMRKIAAALSAGCSIVIKPSEEAPGTAVVLVRCFAEAGVPAGVLNLVFGVPAEVSEHLIPSPLMRFVAFTGSIAVGKHLARAGGRRDEADHDGARRPCAGHRLSGRRPRLRRRSPASGASSPTPARSARRRAASACTRISTTRSSRRSSRRAEAVHVGNGLEPGCRWGHFRASAAGGRSDSFVEDARERGAVVATGGHDLPGPASFYAPTVLVDVPD